MGFLDLQWDRALVSYYIVGLEGHEPMQGVSLEELDVIAIAAGNPNELGSRVFGRLCSFTVSSSTTHLVSV